MSVYNKTGLDTFARGLRGAGVSIYSTGGTLKSLHDAGVPAQSVSDITGFPEIMDGRVKTLHPNVHGGLLAVRENADHMRELAAHGIEPIDIVIGNLYPFVETVSKSGSTLADALENIDIGGPTMIRAAAKNFTSVLVVVDPNDYAHVLEGIGGGGISIKERRRLAQKAFQHVAFYDTAVATYLRGDDDALPSELTIGLSRKQSLRYGENPHQQSTFYQEVLGGINSIAGAEQLHGKELSHNNLLDADAAWSCANDFADPTFAVIKHANPCGLASHDELKEAYLRSYAGDPVSAFGGIVACNRTLTIEVAEEIAKIFYEVIIAPDFEPAAFERLRRKRDLRILKAPSPSSRSMGLDYRRVSGGMLVQTRDDPHEDPDSWQTVTSKTPTAHELADLAFAWRAAKHVKSNAIVLAKDRSLLGMGAGQPNRVTSVHLALRAGADKVAGSVMGSDAFFPFPDGVELAAQGGITAIAQPGGSIRDNEVIEAANRAGIAMVFTGVRHFRH